VKNDRLSEGQNWLVSTEAEADGTIAKYYIAAQAQSYSFLSIAAETMGAINSDDIEFLSDLGLEGALHNY